MNLEPYFGELVASMGTQHIVKRVPTLLCVWLGRGLSTDGRVNTPVQNPGIETAQKFHFVYVHQPSIHEVSHEPRALV